MGEAKRKRSTTQTFIETFPNCCFCGGARPSATREHMPPKALFDGSHRPDDLVMPACKECNNKTSTADAVVSIVSRWRAMDMTEIEKQDHKRLVDGLKRSSPEIFEEWTKMSLLDRLRAKRDYMKDGIDIGASGLVRIGPHTIRQLNLFAHKAALALYFDHFRKLLPNTGRVSVYWRTKEDVLRGGIPAVLLEMMNRYGTLEQGKWRTSETFEYRYDLNIADGLFAFLARARGNFYITGFAVEDAGSIVGDEDEDGWIAPSALLGMLDEPRFETRRG